MKLKSNVPLVGIVRVKMLIIESDENDTGGFFVYYYLNENTAYDTWNKTLNDAFKAAEMQWNCQRSLGAFNG